MYNFGGDAEYLGTLIVAVDVNQVLLQRRSFDRLRADIPDDNILATRLD